MINPSTECKTSSDETRMLGLDIVQCSTDDRVTTHKHASLAISVRHMTGWGIVVLTTKHRCLTLACQKESLAKAEKTGVVISSNITRVKCIQFAGDNNDIREEMLDGKQTTHATTVVIY